MSLTESELERYRRQLLVESWDQEKLQYARVLIAGLGGLGGVSATYLAAAGVGSLRLCDGDKVELSNLNRQILFSTDDIRGPKAALAWRKLSALNPGIQIEVSQKLLTEGNAVELASGSDLIIDGLDNHESRLILNTAAVRLKIPYVYGAINEWQGQTSFIKSPETPCLACLLPNVPKSTGPVPVYGALPGVIGAMQASMAIRYLMTGESPLEGRLLIYRADTMDIETVSFEKNPQCPICAV